MRIAHSPSAFSFHLFGGLFVLPPPDGLPVVLGLPPGPFAFVDIILRINCCPTCMPFGFAPT